MYGKQASDGSLIKAVRDYGYRARPEPPADGASSSVFWVSGLDCADCAARLEKRIAALDGVEEAAINFGSGRMNVTHTAPALLVINAVKDAGYSVEMRRGAHPGDGDGQRKTRLLTTALSGVFMAAGFISGLLGAGEYAAAGLFLMGILSGGFPVARSGFYAARSLSLDMNFLMTVAVLGAVAIGQWAEGAMVVFLFALGNYLQAYTIDKTRHSIRELMELSPREAQVRRDGGVLTVPVEDVLPGDAVIVKPGQNIPVDGKVKWGNSSVNQAPITGESAPAEKGPGDQVYAGTINQEGALEVEASCRFRDTTLSRIIGLVEEAQAQKAPSQQLVDRFSFYYTPAVLAVALASTLLPVFFFQQPFVPWFEKSLILLVISCPCALVISTPVSIISAIGSAAKKGVLIKGGAYLEEAGQLDTVAFDKTGTLTYGRPCVTEVTPVGGAGRAEVLAVAAAVEAFSEHPLAGSVVEKAREEGLAIPPAADFVSFAGKGAGAEVAGKRYYVGSLKLFEELGAAPGGWRDRADQLLKGGKTVVLVGSPKGVMGIITLTDRVRPGLRNIMGELKAVGIRRVVMLTGDNAGTAGAVAAEAGVAEYRADLLPREKLEAIRELKKAGRVAMVGDGINDAPALALADIGIAMGGAGTDTAIETADIALMADDLSRLPYAIRLSRKALKTIKQNIAFALLIKAVFITMTFFGYGTLWMAVFADTGASLLVTLNGMRLLRVKG
ncbi:MAG: cadmium-translocating P-type ATPase [Firmicutes bacterium]|nr:cadmium-translocating P-type ATPase [Bacillota bacterium]MCL5058046.1 cadmium-translocating P-type ATPase [Actinomycetota bacterium]